MKFEFAFPVLCSGAICLALAMAACAPAGTAEEPASAASQQAEAVHPISGLQIIPVTVRSGDTVHTFRTELAQSREAQAQGLMFRTELADDEAMIFPSEPQTARSFWMKNTPLPLDIIFIGTDGRILNIAAMTEPYSLESVYSVGVTSGVLEIRGGLAEELGIEPGDLVEW
ncbi:DUF192 domain-containing protein [Erythrobacter aquimaris]|uniref:DUF192 domain-containing protein n=1 Tax=Qipengyuania aquimaris TaxID=255984 RepID=A0A6I4TMF4_9SPHN|nr:DUF192 domain-containing protein [Qipengyuania aquimaris]MXO96459.1 DUF192 domain-containing protein [Qipengyuania aquimaris]